MNKTALTLFVSLLASATLFAAPENYEIDAAHSTVGFKIKHLFSKVGGRFAEVTGKLTADADKPEASTVEATIKVKSVDTANAQRDAHLQKDDFFAADKFPEITFKSKSVKVIDKESATVLGDLTMHGVTKEVPLTVKFLGKGKGMAGEVSGWEATTKINRRDFGLTWGRMVEGVAAVGDEVEIEIQIEAKKV